MRYRSRSAVALATTVIVLSASATFAYPRPGRTTLVSVGLDGNVADGLSTGGSLSADGRYIAFRSDAPNIVPEKPNRWMGIYVRDLATGDTRLASAASDGTPAVGHSGETAMSGGGRYVALTSSATNLVSNDTNGRTDTFVHDLETGTTERVTVAPDGTEANASSQNVSISADGRFIAFASRATNLTDEPTSGELHAFVKDRVEGTVHLASRSSDGVEGNGPTFFPELSPDGRYVVYYTFASNLIPDDTNGRTDVYLYDLENQTTERVSVTWKGAQANESSNRPVVSENGRYVAFASHATNLVPNGESGLFPFDVYVRDRQRRTTERVSTTSAGVVGSNSSFTPQISPDGRYVIFTSIASDLVRGDTNCPAGTVNLALCRDVFLHDRTLLRTERVSLGNDEVEGNAAQSVGSMSADASSVAFFGTATNFFPGDDNDDPDVFVRERGGELDAVDLDVAPLTDEVRVSGGGVFSGTTLTKASAGQLLFPDTGVELWSADLLYHPEEEALLVRWRLNGMHTLAGRPLPVVYAGFSFTTGTGRYEIRVAHEPAPQVARTQTRTRAALYRCEGECVHVGDLSGSFGTTGPEARAELPLEIVGLEEGDPLTGMRAYVALGHPDLGESGRTHGLDLAPTEISERVVRLGVAPPGAPADAAVWSDVAVEKGRFNVSLPVDQSSYRVWVRVCLGQTCNDRFVDVAGADPSPEPTATPTTSPLPTESATPTPTMSPAPATTELSFTDASATAGQHSDASFFEARLTGADGTPIPGQQVTFELTGDGSSRNFTAITDGDGRASVTPTLSERPGPYQLTVRYEGDAIHADSADTASFVVEREDSDMTLIVEGKGGNRTLTARLSDRDSVSDGIAGRTVDFFADSQLIGSSVTDGDGIATLKAPPGYRGGKHEFEARFDGDGYYLGAADGEQT